MQASSTLNLSPIPTGWHTLRYTVLSDGSLAVAVTDVDLASEWARVLNSVGAVEPPSRIDQLTQNGRLRLLTWGAGGWQEGPTVPLEMPHLLVDRFADGRWLVVGSRTRGEPNARVFATSGKLLDRFMLGDGIEHVATDDADRVWVGWFDEGVFGNDEWQLPGHEWPPSSNGVACFADDGSLIAKPSMPDGVEHIADCYALTADGTGAWACPYTDFPLLHLAPGERTRWWRGAPAGSKAIAVDRDFALLAGGYGKDLARLTLFALDGAGQGEDARPLATGQLPLRPAQSNEGGFAPAWEYPNLLTGRGDTLHLIDDGLWSRWRVGDVAAAFAHS